MFLPNHTTTKDTKAMIREGQERPELRQGGADYSSFISICRSWYAMWYADGMKKLCENVKQDMTLTVESFVISAMWVCWLGLICISI